MSNEVFVFVADKKSTAQSKAKVMITKGYDVNVIGPADSIILRSLIGETAPEDIWGIEIPETWLVVCSNKT